MGLNEWAYWSEQHCPYEATWLTQILVIPHNTTIFLSVALYVIGLVRRELFLLFLGVGITLNGALNWLLKWLFSSPVPFAKCGIDAVYCIDANAAWVVPVGGGPPEPPNACGTPPWPAYDAASAANCGAPPLSPCDPCVSCGMPAFEVQDTAFFVTVLVLYMFTWRHPHIQSVHTALLIAWLAIIAWGHSFFGFNSPPQILVGGAVGSNFALVLYVVFFALVYPRFDAILGWNVVRWMGYKDTFCKAARPAPGDVYM